MGAAVWSGRTRRRPAVTTRSNREPQVGDLTRGGDKFTLERDRAEARGLNEPDTVAEQDGHQMNSDLVAQAGTKALRGEVGSKEDDSLASGCVFGGRHRVVHGSGNERDGRMGIR